MISACLILKNNENTIKDTIKSIERHCSEIVCVIDTASSDKTETIIQEIVSNTTNCNFIVCKREWNDNFADARNFAIEQATGKYIFTIDGDEVLHSEAPLKKYIEFCEQKDTMAYAIKVINSNAENVTVSFSNLRLFRNIPEIRYYGMQHATVDKSVVENDFVIASIEDIYIEHTGHRISKEEMIKRMEKKLELHFIQLQKEPDNPFVNYYIGGIFLTLFLEKNRSPVDLSNALHYLNLAYITDNLSSGMKARILYKLARLHFAMGDMRATVKYLDKSFDIQPQQIIGRILLCDVLRNTKQYDKIKDQKKIVEKINGKSKLSGDIHHLTDEELNKLFNETKIKEN